MTVEQSAGPRATSTAPALPAVLGGVDLTDQAAFAAGFPYDVFARLRRRAPVLRHPPGDSADGESFWVLSRYADIVTAATDPAFSAQGGGSRAGGGSHLDDLEMGVYAGALLGMMDDPRHARIVNLLTPRAGGPAVAVLEPELRRCAANLLDAAIGQGTCDLAADVCGPFGMRAVALALGVPRDDWPQLLHWNSLVSNVMDRAAGISNEHSWQIGAAVLEYCRRLLADKRRAPGDDLASALALGEIAGEPPLSAYERDINAWLLLLTGSEQPRNTIAGAVLALARHPDQWHALRADRSLLPTAVEEVLRWAPPNPYNRRTATRDVVLAGTSIRAGEKLTLWWPSGNRDETVFAQPSTFDIRRDPNPHLSFGAGRHHCLGDSLGRVELRVFLDELLDRVAEVRLTGPVTYQPSNKHTVVRTMPVELVPAAR